MLSMFVSIIFVHVLVEYLDNCSYIVSILTVYSETLDEDLYRVSPVDDEESSIPNTTSTKKKNTNSLLDEDISKQLINTVKRWLCIWNYKFPVNCRTCNLRNAAWKSIAEEFDGINLFMNLGLL